MTAPQTHACSLISEKLRDTLKENTMRDRIALYLKTTIMAIVGIVILGAPLVAAASPNWPNEPAGATVINDYDMRALFAEGTNPGGWQQVITAGQNVVVDSNVAGDGLRQSNGQPYPNPP